MTGGRPIKDWRGGGPDMSKETFEWQRRQSEIVHQRISEALRKLNVEAGKVRHHFSDDPEDLEKWDEYMEDVNYAFSSKLPYFLCKRNQDSLLYKQLMRRKAHPTPSVSILTRGYEKVKQATRNRMVRRAAVIVTIAAAFAAGVAAGPTLWKREQAKKT